jgi:hypothetical protein
VFLSRDLGACPSFCSGSGAVLPAQEPTCPPARLPTLTCLSVTCCGAPPACIFNSRSGRFTPLPEDTQALNIIQ